MSPEVQAFASGFGVTLGHAALSIVILFAASAVYALLSPQKEVQAVQEGNGAAAVSLAGVVLGLAAPLCFSLTASTSLIELALWGVGLALVQLLIFALVDLLLKGLPQRVGEGDVFAAVLLTSARLATAVILAAAAAG